MKTHTYDTVYVTFKSISFQSQRMLKLFCIYKIMLCKELVKIRPHSDPVSHTLCEKE